jgi:putative heme degradation protein
VGRKKRSFVDQIKYSAKKFTTATINRITNTITPAVKQLLLKPLSAEAKAIRKSLYSNKITTDTESSIAANAKIAARNAKIDAKNAAPDAKIADMSDVFKFKHVLPQQIAADPEKFRLHFFDLALRLHNHGLLPTIHSPSTGNYDEVLKKWCNKAKNMKLTFITSDINDVAKDITAVKNKVSWENIKFGLFLH